MFKANKANKNPTKGHGNLSSKQYRSGTRNDTKPGVASTNNYSRSLGEKMNAPAMRHTVKSHDAGARCCKDFSNVGGYGAAAIEGTDSPRKGTGTSGSKLAQANRSPKYAQNFASFDNVGGTAKKPTLG